jgi:hypothetical protein
MMRRLSNGAIQIEPYDPCYCGSDKKVKFCHPIRKRGEIARPHASECRPPLPQTGLARSGCYARQLNDCSSEMSGEHLISEVMLNLLAGADGKVIRMGYPWQVEGEFQSLPPSTYKANVLCKRHNNALSPLDSTAGAFFKGILKAPQFLQNNDLRVLILSGDDLERWILKTLCTHILVMGKFGKNWEPPLEWLEILWSVKPFPPGCGLYFNHEVGQSTPDMAKLALRVLTSPGIAGATGAMVELGPYRFGLAMVPPNPHQTSESVLIPKFYRPSDFVISYGNHEVVYSFSWEAPVVPRRIGISWAPNS